MVGVDILGMELKAQKRDIAGKKTKDLRKTGLLPAVLYGPGIKNISVAVPYKDFEKIHREAGESTVIKLDLEGKTYNVLIHDVAYSVIKGEPIHADFYAVEMDKPIRAKVQIEFTGESPAAKNYGGILVKVMQAMELEALPQDLPHELKADLSLLKEFADRILVKDIKLPVRVKIFAGLDEIVALVEQPRSEAELEALKKSEGPAVAATVAEVKTEREVKAEEKSKETAEEEKK